MLFVYNWPSSIMGLFVVTLTLTFALGGYAFFRRVVRVRPAPEEQSMTIAMVSVITTINSLLIAFAAINVWGAYSDAAHNVDLEATTAGELARDLAAFGEPPAGQAVDALHAYLDGVVRFEWPKMQQEAVGDPRSETRFDTLFDKVNHIQPRDERQRALLSEVLKRVNELAKLRDQRLLTLDVAMPATLWAVMLIASAVSFLLLYTLPGTMFNVALIAAWALTLGLAFFFVLAVDRPFAGRVSVGPEPLAHVVQALNARAQLTIGVDHETR